MLIICVLIIGCHSNSGSSKPSLQITHVPAADAGGPVRMDFIEGRVVGAKPGQQVVLYARSGGVWWIQPLVANPYTKIQTDLTWKNTTHLGTDYAALLVEPGYRPGMRIGTLPTEGNGVVAVAVAKGEAGAPIIQKVVHFSGYDWTVLAAGSDRGGEANPYDPANVWTDQKGYLHLHMEIRNGQWTCAEVNLTHSLGYGTYRFVVQDSAHLEPSAVLGMYVFDLEGKGDGPSELDIELSRWGNPKAKNAQYVVQPFYVPENVARFSVPAGVFTHSFRWEPGVTSFQTVAGSATTPGSKVISSHVFTAGVPPAAAETVHLDFYDFHHSQNLEQHPVEVVIEKFEYLP